MYPTLRDCATGKERVCSDWDTSVYWWTEGNGACDCNRAMAMGVDQDDEKCLTVRFVAVAVHGDLEGYTEQEILTAMNEGYASHG